MIGFGWNILYLEAGLHESLQPCSRAARKWRENEEMKRKWRENEEMKRKWRENEEMEREIHSQDFLILCLFPPSLSISYIKNCHILSQNVKYGTFVANVTKNLTYALWGNNSGSNSLRGSSASCAGLASAPKSIFLRSLPCLIIRIMWCYYYRALSCYQSHRLFPRFGGDYVCASLK